NGAEGEPASKKDRMLLRELPHLVLDGVAVAARAVGAEEAVVTFAETDQRSARSLERAVRERWDDRTGDDPRFHLFAVRDGFVSGQETALVSALNGEAGKPTFGARPFEHGVHRRPTLVQNVETLAHLALIARHGAAWFRQLGTAQEPGSRLVTMAGAVEAPGVYEIEQGVSLAELLDLAGAEPDFRAVLLGGYFGSWLPAPLPPDLRLAREDLRPHGASLGAGVVVLLPRSACPVAETTRVADYLASESAGQCGPCVNGLSAIADALQQLASGTAAGQTEAALERWTREVPGRGACQHPDGAARFVSSALRAFAEEFRDHARHGPCDRCRRSRVLLAPSLAATAAA
ncbi:MAG: hypothetical protein JO372_12830, partial [Solirubrobacterales bacterium]|nr:hypothetical protein [Solirubrobacterales bacterium]